MPLDLNTKLATAVQLPEDRDAALLIGRAWVPVFNGPSVVAVRGDDLVDLSAVAPTVSDLLNTHAITEIQAAIAKAPVLAAVAATLRNSAVLRRDESHPWLLAPCDLQPVKACGVTFISSLLERLIEERAKGDPSQAAQIRAQIGVILGDDLSAIKPGSPEALRIKDVLIAQGAWSPYLEVGIGPDAEVFSKCPPLASVGTGADIGLHPMSHWNNPEPEVVLAVTGDGRIVGAALGNDVNLRDIEGRSTLLLGKAKDNNGSCAIGPFIRLFDDNFSLDDVRVAEIALSIQGEDGFHLQGSSSMRKISRDPADLVAQVMGPHHQYPDGMMVFLGTMFAPSADRDAVGQGFTHHDGDLVVIASPRLGSIVNRVGRSDRIIPWHFGLQALMRNLASRDLL